MKSGWEVVSSAEFTTTPGFELVTWVFKKSVTPIGDGNGAVVALMLTPPNRSVIIAFVTMWYSRIVMHMHVIFGGNLWWKCTWFNTPYRSSILLMKGVFAAAKPWFLDTRFSLLHQIKRKCCAQRRMPAVLYDRSKVR